MTQQFFRTDLCVVAVMNASVLRMVTGAPRVRLRRSLALPALTAISRWSVLPKSAHTSPAAGVGVRRHDAADTVRGGGDLDAVRVGELVEQLPIDVRHEIAEAVDAQHLAGQHVVRRSPATESSAAESCPADRPSAERSTPFASQPPPARTDRAPRTCGSPLGAHIAAPSARPPAWPALPSARPSARRCPARRNGSRPCRRQCRGAPIPRPDRRRRGRSCPAESTCSSRRARASPSSCRVEECRA